MKLFDSVTDHHLEGRVLLVPSEFGGRKDAVHSGYRGRFLWHLAGATQADWMAESYFENDVMAPGESGRIKIKLTGHFLEQIRLAKTIFERAGLSKSLADGSFALREGARIVAVGVITKSLFENAEGVSD